MEDLLLPHGISTQNDIDKKVFALCYESSKTQLELRIILDRHLFSVLLEGEKVVSYASAPQIIDHTSSFFMPYGNCLMAEKLTHDGQYKSV